MPFDTDHLPDKETINRFIESEQGKTLLAQLNQSDPAKIRYAVEKAVAGDISSAMGILRTVLSSTEDHSKKEVPHGK